MSDSIPVAGWSLTVHTDRITAGKREDNHASGLYPTDFQWNTDPSGHDCRTGDERSEIAGCSGGIPGMMWESVRMCWMPVQKRRADDADPFYGAGGGGS